MNADIRNLVAELEATRVAQVHRLANAGEIASDNDIRTLADVQSALLAAREVLEVHQPRLGYGSDSTVNPPFTNQQWSGFRNRLFASHG